MEKEKATIYNYARMCKFYDNCNDCPLFLKCGTLIAEETDKANEIILKWIKEHPVKTRQSKFLEMFPNARMYEGEFVDICPCHIDEHLSNQMNCAGGKCTKCKKEFWLAEVEE